MKDMQPIWNNEKHEYYLDIPIENQTFHMAFQETHWTPDSVYFNIYMTLYTKRKHINKNEELIKSTGLNPLQTIVVARKCFEILEKIILNEFDYLNIVITCDWLDKQRREIYHKFLSKKGYRYGLHPFYKNKCLIKIQRREKI